MTIKLRPATDRDVREFVAWRYEPPHDAYNITTDPDEAVEYFLGADIHCHTLIDGDVVVGYCTFGHDAQVPDGDYTADALDVSPSPPATSGPAECGRTPDSTRSLGSPPTER